MTRNRPAELVRLSDTGRTVADPADDIRGRTVRDRHGDDIGKVDELLVDPSSGTVHLLRVTHGGILGFGATPSFVPVEAITGVGEEIHIDRSRGQVAGAPRYDPQLTDEIDYYGEVYGYYGFAPFWTPGYVPTTLPKTATTTRVDVDEPLALEQAGWRALSSDPETATRFYEAVLDERAVMLLPGGLILTDRDDMVRSMGDRPWESYELGPTDELRPMADMTVLWYTVHARRAGSPPYSALVSTTYVRRPDGWRVVAHQQTARLPDR
jgi:sporulation protein YlmC with PRC-barrel domain